MFSIDFESVVPRQLIGKSISEIIKARMPSKKDMMRTKLRTKAERTGSRHGGMLPICKRI